MEVLTFCTASTDASKSTRSAFRKDAEWKQQFVVEGDDVTDDLVKEFSLNASRLPVF